MLFFNWTQKRRFCRKTIHVYSFLFSAILLSAPFIVLGDQKTISTDEGIFGLHPDLIKLAFFLLFSFVVWLLNNSIKDNTRNNNTLFANQRELAQCLTKLTVLHCVNHPQQTIDAPKMTGKGEEEL